MPIPSKETIIEGLAKDSIEENCEYFPCHTKMEACNLCFCLFYPCEDTRLGFYKISKKGMKIWSCVNCEWIHRKDIVNAARRFMNEVDNPNFTPVETYNSFLKFHNA